MSNIDDNRIWKRISTDVMNCIAYFSDVLWTFISKWFMYLEKYHITKKGPKSVPVSYPITPVPSHPSPAQPKLKKQFLLIEKHCGSYLLQHISKGRNYQRIQSIQLLYWFMLFQNNWSGLLDCAVSFSCLVFFIHF